jgi:hypothetical protein
MTEMKNTRGDYKLRAKLKDKAMCNRKIVLFVVYLANLTLHNIESFDGSE